MSGRVNGLADELAAFVGSALATPDKYGRAARSAATMSDYFRNLIGKRRASPRDDLLSALVAASERYDMTGDNELVATAILLLFAGHETTTNLIGNGILSLLRHPAELDALRADPSLIAQAIEELLRYGARRPRWCASHSRTLHFPAARSGVVTACS